MAEEFDTDRGGSLRRTCRVCLVCLPPFPNAMK